MVALTAEWSQRSFPTVAVARDRFGGTGTNVESALRLLRAGAFAAVCVALTTAGHELAGGAAVGPGAVGFGFAVLFAAGVAFGERERSGTAIAAAMLAGQVGLHQLFTAFDGPMTGMADPPGVDSAHGQMCSGVVMLGVHIGLAAVSGWWLRRGEVACWRLVRRVESRAAGALCSALRHLVGALADPFAGRVGPGPRAFVLSEPASRMTSLRVRCEPRRGPPWPLVSAAGGRM